MSTPYSKFIDGLLRRVEEDKDFFHYINLSDIESLELAKSRSLTFLDEAIALLTLKCTPDINFYNKNDDTKEFNFDVTGTELFLIISLMYQQYLDRDIAKLKCLNVNYTSSDLRVFDPSNARNTFKALYDGVCLQNDKLVDDYANKDRLTGKPKSIDFASYDSDE